MPVAAGPKPGRRVLRLSLWIVLSGVALIIVAGLILSSPAMRQSLRNIVYGPPSVDPPGHWNPMREPAVAVAPTYQQEQIDKLLSLGYTGSTNFTAGRAGITVNDTLRAHQGLRFFLSGHAPQAVLMSVEGRVLHTWYYDYRDLWSANPKEFMPPKSATGCWRRARLLPDGSLFAIYEGHGLIKLDKDSNLLWSCASKCHHDLDLDDQGRIYVLSREAKLVPRLHEDEPVLLDYVTVLDSTGTHLRSIDLLAAFERSPYADLLPKPPVMGDPYHNNTLELLRGRLADRSPAFRAGNILLSVREMDVIAVLDPETETIVWALKRDWSRQHQPTVLDSGRLLLFDNLGHDGHSRVIEFDPFTQQDYWTYANSPATPLFSQTCGSNQRLGNGNTLIVETDAGRALEVTPDRTVVWEYINPYRAGEKNNLIAAVMDMEVVPETLTSGWLKQSP